MHPPCYPNTSDPKKILYIVHICILTDKMWKRSEGEYYLKILQVFSNAALSANWERSRSSIQCVLGRHTNILTHIFTLIISFSCSFKLLEEQELSVVRIFEWLLFWTSEMLPFLRHTGTYVNSASGKYSNFSMVYVTTLLQIVLN